MAAKEKRGTKIVVIDPRRTATAELADLHLGIKPGIDVALFNGLLVYLHNHGKTNQQFVSEHISGQANLWPTRGVLRLRRQLVFHNQNLKISIASSPIRARGHSLVAGCQSVECRDRQGQCHYQLPPADWSHRACGHGTILSDGPPNAMGGRRLAVLPISAAHMAIEAPVHRDRSSASGLALYVNEARPQSRGHVRGGA